MVSMAKISWNLDFNCFRSVYTAYGITLQPILSDEGLMLETSAFKLLTEANLRYQLSWWYTITFLYSPTNAAPKFL